MRKFSFARTTVLSDNFTYVHEKETRTLFELRSSRFRCAKFSLNLGEDIRHRAHECSSLHSNVYIRVIDANLSEFPRVRATPRRSHEKKNIRRRDVVRVCQTSREKSEILTDLPGTKGGNARGPCPRSRSSSPLVAPCVLVTVTFEITVPDGNQ